jgi:hypothetical protein
MPTSQSRYSDRIDELVSLAKQQTLPLHFIRRKKQTAINAQQYAIAALYRDVELRLLKAQRP